MAKQVKISRKDLKEADQFVSSTELFLAYCSQYRSVLTGLFIGIVVLFAGVMGYWYNAEVKAMRMEALYFEMNQALNKEKQGVTQEVIAKLENLLGQFSEGAQKQRGALLLADAYYQKKQYNKAINLYSETLENSPPDQLQYPLAQIGLASSLEGKKEYAKAIAVYKELIEGTTDFPLFNVYLSLSHCHELNNDPNGALQVLREMKNKFPAHEELEQVNREIQKLSAKV